MCKPEAVEPVPGLGLRFMFILFKFRILLACNDLRLGLGSFSSTSWESEHFTSEILQFSAYQSAFHTMGRSLFALQSARFGSFFQGCSWISASGGDWAFYCLIQPLGTCSCCEGLERIPRRFSQSPAPSPALSAPSLLQSFHPLPHTWASRAGERFSVLTLNIDRFVQTHSMTEVLWGSKYSDWLTLLLKLQ